MAIQTQNLKRSRAPRKPGPTSGPAEKTQLPAISATEQQLQFIRRQIQELEQARNSRGPKLRIKTFILVFKFGLI